MNTLENKILQSIAKEPAHEPKFVLTASDPSAASFVDQWADFNSYKLGKDHILIKQARLVAQAMRVWVEDKTKQEM